MQSQSTSDIIWPKEDIKRRDSPQIVVGFDLRVFDQGGENTRPLCTVFSVFPHLSFWMPSIGPNFPSP